MSAITSCTDSHLVLVPGAGVASGKGSPTRKSESKPGRQPGEYATLPVKGYDSRRPEAVHVDARGLRASLEKTISEKGRGSQVALLEELERLTPQVQDFVDGLRATPALELFDVFVQQLQDAGVKEQVEHLRGLGDGDKLKVAQELKDNLLAGSMAHLAECQAWLAHTREDREELMTSAAKQWMRVLRNAWKPVDGPVPDAIATLAKKEDWQDISNVQAGARYGNLGDLLASSVGVAHTMASGNYSDLVRLLITGSGVTGGYITDKGFGMRLEDPQADTRSNLGKAFRPLQHPDRAGFVAYMPAAIAIATSGAFRLGSEQAMIQAFGASLDVTGVPDLAGGLALAAGFGAVILMNDPRTGEIQDRVPGHDVHIDPSGEWLRGSTGEPVVPPGMVPDVVAKDPHTGDEVGLSLHKYLSIPEGKRPEIAEVRLRKPVLADRLNKGVQWGIDAVDGAKKSLTFKKAQGQVGATNVDSATLAKAQDWAGRFQVFAALSSLTTVMTWFSAADRGSALVNDLPQVMSGFAEGPGSPNFWNATVKVATVAAAAAMAFFYTKSNLKFAADGQENQKREREALDHGYLNVEAYERDKAAGRVEGMEPPSQPPPREPPLKARWKKVDGRLVREWKPTGQARAPN